MARVGEDGIGSHLNRLRFEVGSGMYRVDEGVPTRTSHGTTYSVQIRLLLPKRPAKTCNETCKTTAGKVINMTPSNQRVDAVKSRSFPSQETQNLGRIGGVCSRQKIE